MKRQRGRNRTGGGPPINVKPGQNANRAFDSNGPDNVKVRGHSQHVYEKYQQLARDAAAAGDPVLAENYLQHGEHYFRTLRVLQPNRPVTDIINRDSFASGFDLDFEDAAVESAMEQADAGAAAAEAQGPVTEVEPEPRQDRFRERSNFERSSFDRQDRQGGDRPFNDRNGAERSSFADRQTGDRQNYDRQNADRQNADRQNADRQNADRQTADRQNFERQGQERAAQEYPRQDRQSNERQPNDRQGGERQGGDRQGGDRHRYEGRQDRFRDRDRTDDRGGARPERERFDRETVATTELTTPAAPESDSPMLRSLDGGVSEAPAFLAAAPVAAPGAAGDEPERRPRRRRRTPSDDAAPTSLPESEDA